MAILNPYLNFMGNTEEAFNFYKAVFGGEFLALQRFKDIPMADPMPAEVQDKIMHIALPIGKGNMLMGTDALESQGPNLIIGTNMSLTLSVDSEAEADTLFSKLQEGGQITMPLEKVFWGDYFGMLTDKYGIQWMVSYTYPKEEQDSRAYEAAQSTSL